MEDREAAGPRVMARGLAEARCREGRRPMAMSAAAPGSRHTFQTPARPAAMVDSRHPRR
jgi:hypothetical protein